MEKAIEVKVLTKPERCKQCALCISVCPTDSISFGEEMNSAGYRFTVINQETCIACGMCYATCPDGVYTILGDK